ncbi:hypothetical protein HYU23_01975 [Candidatus Woesearchaeota archaeon]|nr:hypothetical protein [Candidatus Woesearchaeota archaeon]
MQIQVQENKITLINPDLLSDSFLQELNSFQAPWLAEKLLSEKVFYNIDEYNVAFIEFKKYVILASLYEDERLAMTSKKVDAVWHQFILFTKEYALFCKKFLGKYLHHSPNTSFTPLNEGSGNKFRELYIKTFGKLHPIWIKNKSFCAECDDYDIKLGKKAPCASCEGDYDCCAGSNASKK